MNSMPAAGLDSLMPRTHGHSCTSESFWSPCPNTMETSALTETRFLRGWTTDNVPYACGALHRAENKPVLEHDWLQSSMKVLAVPLAFRQHDIVANQAVLEAVQALSLQIHASVGLAPACWVPLW